MVEMLDVLRPDRMQRRSRILTRAATRDNIRTRKEENDILSIIFLVVEELKNNNEEIKASIIEFK
jgi:hypothetical protein